MAFTRCLCITFLQNINFLTLSIEWLRISFFHLRGENHQKTAVLRSSLQCSFIHDIYMMMSSQHQRYMAVHKASVEIALHQIHRANCRAQFHHSAFFTIASLDAMFFKCNTQSQYFASTCVRRTFCFVCSARIFLFVVCGFILFAACGLFCSQCADFFVLSVGIYFVCSERIFFVCSVRTFLFVACVFILFAACEFLLFAACRFILFAVYGFI